MTWVTAIASVAAAQQASAAGKYNQAVQERNAKVKEQEAEQAEKQLDNGNILFRGFIPTQRSWLLNKTLDQISILYSHNIKLGNENRKILKKLIEIQSKNSS